MRVVRTILGILLLTIGLPLLLAGGGLWTAMQHRDAGGAFSGDLENINTGGYAVVVTDVDKLLQRQAPFVRGEQTRLRLTAQTPTGPAFIAMARPTDVARFLAGVEHIRVDEVKLARGALPVRAAPVPGEAEPASGPRDQHFWARSGIGTLEWSPSTTRGRQLAVVIMSVDGERLGRVSATTELRVGWLNSSTWGLLVLGTVLLLLGILLLGWPARSREVVYVVEPSQVPDIAARLGVPVPSLAGVRGSGQGVGRHSSMAERASAAEQGVARHSSMAELDGATEHGAGHPVGGAEYSAANRPATLAESATVESASSPAKSVAPPVAPMLDWPPVSANAKGRASEGAVLDNVAAGDADAAGHADGSGEQVVISEQAVSASASRDSAVAQEPSDTASANPSAESVVPSQGSRGEAAQAVDGSDGTPGEPTPEGSGTPAEPTPDQPVVPAQHKPAQAETPASSGSVRSVEPEHAAVRATVDGDVAGDAGATGTAGGGLAADPGAGPARSADRVTATGGIVGTALDETAGPVTATRGSDEPVTAKARTLAELATKPIALPPAGLAPRSTRRRRANTVADPGGESTEPGGRRVAPAARTESQPGSQPGAGIAAAVAAGGRRPTRSRAASSKAKAKPSTPEEADPSES